MKQRILAVVFEGEGDIRIKEIPLPKLRNEFDVLLKLEIASICGSDVQIAKVPMGHPATKGVILGHEYVGTVSGFGESVKGLNVGDMVAIEPLIYCDNCYYCKSGFPNLCENMIGTGAFADGGFAEYSVINYKAVHKLNKDTPAEIIVFAEPLSCVLNSLDKLNIKIGDNVVVFGAGPIGLMFIKALKAAGVSKLIVSEKIKLRQEIARQCGAIVVDPEKEDLMSIIKKETGIGADIAIDCVGSLLNEAMKCVRKAGKLLLFGINSNAQNTIKPYDITHNEIEIIGGFITKFTFVRAIKLLEERIINVEDLITHTYKLSDFKEAVSVINEGKAVKVLLRP